MMTIPHSVAEILKQHVTLEVEGIDRMYLNAYVPRLQVVEGVLGFIRRHRGHPVPSTRMVEPITRRFVAAIEQFARDQGIPLVSFDKGQRKEEVAARFRAGFSKPEGVVFIGKAQEKCTIYRTERRRNARTGKSYAWIVKSTALVNHYYFYCVDRDFGPFFLKFCSYFPYNAKLCLNGHEYLKRQLEQRGIAYEALDNGILSCQDPQRLQAISDGLSAAKIEALLRKWLRLLPHPFSARDRQAGYRYDLSILQIELSLTQVLDRPVTGRIFFEEVIRENLDIGRPKQVQLIFDRWVTKSTPGLFRTRVITDGVVPSLHVDYKGTRIKQYHKQGRALRTETTINNARDFYVGKRLHNLPRLRQIGFQANRRLLEVEKISHDCILAEEAFQQINHPRQVETQRASALRFADPKVQSLWNALLLFSLLPTGFSNRELREHLAPLLGQRPEQLTPGRMTYQLRRLRLHGMIQRVPHRHRYRVTEFGLRAALFFTRTYNRVLRPVLAQVLPSLPARTGSLRRCFNRLQQEVDACVIAAQLAA
jgi:DNA-binding HxlR family transcriptional regulator